MSEINPLNNALVRYQQPPLPTLSRSAPDTLSALSSLANSQLKLSSSMENLPFRPPAAPEIASHLQNVSAIAGSGPESRVDRHITLAAPADEAHRGFSASSQGEDIAWSARELPFHAAEEISDKQRDAGLMFLQKAATQLPHVAEQIYLATVEQQKKTLQAYIRGDSGISDQAAAQAWRYFSIESSESRCRALMHIINTSDHFSAADKQRLLRSLQLARVSNGAELREFVSPATPAEAIHLPDLPPGSLSADTLEMLAKFGATQQELRQFRAHAVRAALIRETLLDGNWHHAESKLYALTRRGDISLEDSSLVNTVIIAFRNLSFDLSRIISKDIKSHGPDKDSIYSSDLYSSPHGEKIICQLYYNYLHAMPRIELYKEIRSHILSLTENKLTPPKKPGLLNYRNNQPQIKKLLDNSYEIRSNCLINNMPILPFVFDIKGARPEAARAVAPYGDKGLPFSFFDNLVSNPDISLQRLVSIGLFSTLEMVKITNTGEFPVEWMAPFSDATLARMFAQRAYPYEPTLNQREMFRYQLRAIQAIKTIGENIIADYDYSDFSKLLAWIKPHLGYEISDDDLAYCLFANSEQHKLTLCRISVRIINAKYPGNNIHYPVDEIAQDFIDFCFDVTRSEANRTPSYTAKLHQQFNENLSLSQVLSLIAQRLHLRIIQENRAGDFLQGYDSAGNMFTEPTASESEEEAFILRPGALIPLERNGVQQATIELEHSDNHSLLVALIDYRRETAWRRMQLNRLEQQEEIFQLEAEFVASATADGRERTDVRNQSA